VTPNISDPGNEAARAVTLAPDLRFARERFRKDRLVAWLLNPSALKPNTRMPPTGLSEPEARALAGYLLEAPLAERPVAALPARLPVLTRAVTFDEVNDKVLMKTCRHCHAEPDIAMGDGGPGNTGGFGFKPRQLNLTTYEYSQAGLLDAHGERQSLFAPSADGTPLLVAAILARQREQVTETAVAGVRGMPLGLPALSPEDIQLVESWVAQGRPR
jgi:cytochrome c2